MEELDNFFSDIHSLKNSERKGWKNRDIDRPLDTIASHSFGSALIGWMLAEEEEPDTDKVVKMLLVHDLIMAHIDDVTPDEDEFESKKKREDEMLEELLENIPENIETEFNKLFQEFQENNTSEAKLAHEADKIDTLMQAHRYSQENKDDYLTKFLDFYKKYFNSDSGREIFEELGERSESFSQNTAKPQNDS